MAGSRGGGGGSNYGKGGIGGNERDDVCPLHLEEMVV
jgi:hypothetical protein